MFTDGLKSEVSVSRPFYCELDEFQQILNKSNSIFFAELMAIYFVTELIKRITINNLTLSVDSLSSLKVVESVKLNNSQPMCILLVENVMKSRMDFTFLWVRSHVGIHPKENADQP